MVATFEMWSPFHYFMIIFPFVLAFGLYFMFKGAKESTKQRVAIVISVIMVLILAARSIYIYNKVGALNPEVIPLQVCHFANFTMLITALTKNKVIGAIAWCLNFPAGLVSVIFADSLTNYDNILNIQGLAYIAGHMLIVVCGLYMLMVKIIRIDKKSLMNMYLVVGLMYISSVFINNWFNKIFAHTGKTSNYFYTFKPEQGTPLESFYNMGKDIDLLGGTFNPIYLLLLLVFASILFLLFYGIYLLRNVKS